jgi:hypothetical protein
MLLATDAPHDLRMLLIGTLQLQPVRMASYRDRGTSVTERMLKTQQRNLRAAQLQ